MEACHRCELEGYVSYVPQSGADYAATKKRTDSEHVVELRYHRLGATRTLFRGQSRYHRLHEEFGNGTCGGRDTREYRRARTDGHAASDGERNRRSAQPALAFIDSARAHGQTGR